MIPPHDQVEREKRREKNQEPFATVCLSIANISMALNQRRGGVDNKGDEMKQKGQVFELSVSHEKLYEHKKLFVKLEGIKTGNNL